MIKFEQGQYKKLIKRLWIFSVTALLLFIFFVFAVSVNLFWLFGPMPSLKIVENPRSELASEVYTADGVLMGKYFSQNRSPVEYEQISPNLINALLAAEDIRFYKHAGVDFKATISLPYYLLKGDSKGGSTLSQQVAKNLFETRGDKYKGLLGKVPLVKMLIIKTKEWITAIQLERNYAKEEILTMYLNTVDFGSNAFGVKVAAKTFFNKAPIDLTVEESATLVGVLNAPSMYSPKFHPERSMAKRNVVMSQMVKYGYMTGIQYDKLKTKPIELDYAVENQNKGLAPYFRVYIQDFLLKWADEHDKDLYSDGLKIYTTIDSRMQRYAEEVVSNHMMDQQKKFKQQWEGRNPWVDKDFKEIKTYIQMSARKTDRYRGLKEAYGEDETAIFKEMNKPVRMRVFSWSNPKHEIDTTMSPMDSIRYYKRFLQTGFMSMDPLTGWVKAWVGGIDYKYFKFDHVRQGRRQVGSTFKPIVYATAIDNGFTPCTEVVNSPITFTNNGDGKSWTPHNFDNNFDGTSMTLRQAMGRSVNTIAAYLMREVGPTRVVDMAKRLGVTSPMDAVPSLALGTSDITLYEMLGVYSTFVNGGTYTEPYYLTRIEDKNGNILQEFPVKTYEAISEETAYLMTYMLQGALREPGGTSKGLYRYPCAQGNEIGAKTGTTQNYADGWFIGITHNLVTGLWIGGDEPSIHFRSGAFGQGGRVALPAWGMYMDKVYADATLDIKKGTFKKPDKLSVSLDCASYHQATIAIDSAGYNPPSVDTTLKNKGIL